MLFALAVASEARIVKHGTPVPKRGHCLHVSLLYFNDAKRQPRMIVLTQNSVNTHSNTHGWEFPW
jgi:hypothetical protein